MSRVPVGIHWQSRLSHSICQCTSMLATALPLPCNPERLCWASMLNELNECINCFNHLQSRWHNWTSPSKSKFSDALPLDFVASHFGPVLDKKAFLHTWRAGLPLTELWQRANTAVWWNLQRNSERQKSSDSKPDQTISYRFRISGQGSTHRMDATWLHFPNFAPYAYAPRALRSPRSMWQLESVKKWSTFRLTYTGVKWCLMADAKMLGS